MTTNPLLQSSDFLAQLTSRTVEAFSLMADMSVMTSAAVWSKWGRARS